MFGKRGKRAAQRQRVLEELLWLEPAERERRVIAAVASGEFTADEVEASLRLVSRLDALRELKLPPKGRLVGRPEVDRTDGRTSDQVEMGVASGGRDDEGSGGEDEGVEPVGIPIVTDAVGIPVGPDVVGIPVGPEDQGRQGSDDRRDESRAAAVDGIVVPMDALESAERWLTHSRGRRQAGSAIARKAAEAGAEWQMPAADVPAVAHEDGASIAWLRPH